MLAVAIRIAKRMDIHDESSYTKYDALEAEMCRRLWWSLAFLITASARWPTTRTPP